METTAAQTASIDKKFTVELMREWMQAAGLQVVVKDLSRGSVVVKGTQQGTDGSADVGLFYKIRHDGIVKGPNPENYKSGDKAHQAVVLDIRNLLFSQGLNDYDPQRRMYFHNPGKDDI